MDIKMKEEFCEAYQTNWDDPTREQERLTWIRAWESAMSSVPQPKAFHVAAFDYEVNSYIQESINMGYEDCTMYMDRARKLAPSEDFVIMMVVDR